MRLELKHLSKKYGRQAALDDVDLIFESGSRTALVGPNGSGKSTLMRAVMGTIHCTGEVHFDGTRLRRPPALDYSIAYIPQFAPQTRAPVKDLLDTICQLRGIPLDQVIACASELAFDLGSHLKKELGNLSGGMRQKLMIAMAMAAPVDLLVMDEPTASLAAESRVAFRQMFDRVARDTTVLLASHRPDELRSLVDRYVLLREGRVALYGDASDLLSKSTRTVIELRCAPEGDHLSWLRELGFRQTHPEQWAGLFSAERKAQVLEGLGWRGKENIHDLVVYDVDHMELGGDGEGGDER